MAFSPVTYFPLLPVRTRSSASLIPLDLINLILLVNDYKLLNSSLSRFVQSSVTLSLLVTNMHLNILFANTLSLCSLEVRGQVSHPYKIRGKIIVYNVLIVTFLTSDENTKLSGLRSSKQKKILSPLNFIRQILIFAVVPKHINCATFSNHLSAPFMSRF